MSWLPLFLETKRCGGRAASWPIGHAVTNFGHAVTEFGRIGHEAARFSLKIPNFRFEPKIKLMLQDNFSFFYDKNFSNFFGHGVTKMTLVTKPPAHQEVLGWVSLCSWMGTSHSDWDSCANGFLTGRHLSYIVLGILESLGVFDHRSDIDGVWELLGQDIAWQSLLRVWFR